MASKRLSFATWLRAISTVMILFCHYCAQSTLPWIGMLSQFFNIGVHLFFILSVFLTGYKGIEKPISSWYLKRIKRIYIPFWCFLCVLCSLYLVKGLDVLTADWALLVLGMQGSNVGVWGAEQTWFISAILLCYVLSPFIMEAISRIAELKNKRVSYAFIALVLVMPIVYALVEDPWVYVLLTPVSLYTISCIVGWQYQPSKHPRGRVPAAVAVITAVFVVRIIGKYFWDGTILYDRIIVQYTHMIAASAITFIFLVQSKKEEVPWLVQKISDISFEIYLYHYMFTVGPISLFGCTNSWAVDCVLTTIIVVIISVIFNRLTTWSVQRLSR